VPGHSRVVLVMRVLCFRDDHARRILLEVAQRYARLWLRDTATVRDAPTLKDGQAVLLADYRFALQAALGGDVPPIPEPAWRVQYRMSDWTNGPRGLTARRGARKAPTWTDHVAATAADEWAAALVAQVYPAP
jgi:hypothetical protein